MKDVEIPESFLREGGAELAPMSTTTSLEIAIRYTQGAGGKAVLLRLFTELSLQSGCDLSFLSCFPNEKEVLFPPLTFLMPKPRKKPVTVKASNGVAYTIIDVIPHIP